MSPAPRLRTTRLFAALFLPAALLLVQPPPGEAQQGRSVEWTETTRFELPGTLGAMIRAMPGAGGDRETHHAIHQAGRLLATTDGSSTTILDMEERRWVAVDHDGQSYTTMSFEESAAAMQEMMAAMSEARAGAEDALREAEADRDAAMAEMRQAMQEAQAELTFRVQSESTGRTQSFDGLRAQQHFLTTEIESTGGVEGVDGADEGSLFFLVELWQSDEFPDMDELYRAWAEEMAGDPAVQEMAAELAGSLEPMTGEGGWEMLSLWNPGVAAGLQQLAEAMESVEGTTIRSVTHVAFVPRGLTLDRGELMAWEPGSMGDELRGAAGDAARDAGRDAARGALRGATRGLLGRRGGGDDEPQPEADAPPTVRPLMRMTMEKANIRVGTVDRSSPVFQIPEGFQQQTLPTMGELMGTPPGGGD